MSGSSRRRTSVLYVLAMVLLATGCGVLSASEEAVVRNDPLQEAIANEAILGVDPITDDVDIAACIASDVYDQLGPEALGELGVTVLQPSLAGLVATNDPAIAPLVERCEQKLAKTETADLDEGSGFDRDGLVIRTYPPRELEVIAGGWGYMHSPPFGAVEPGGDAVLDELWVRCRNGLDFQCDELAANAPLGSSYEAFGYTCGGRTVNVGCDVLFGHELHPAYLRSYDAEFDPYQDRRRGFRLERIPGPNAPPPGDDTERDVLWVKCGHGSDWLSCFRLYRERGIPMDLYEAYGFSCGGRRSFPMHSCRALLALPEDRIPNDTPPPGTVPEADELWVACAEDPSNCLNLAFHTAFMDNKPADWDQRWAPYRFFADSCGGVYDRPLVQDTCAESYLDWPVIDDVASLPLPPSSD